MKETTIEDYLTCAHAESTGWDDDGPDVNFSCSVGNINKCCECDRYAPVIEREEGKEDV